MTAVAYHVDARLLHATTLNTWVPFLGARVAIVADDEVFESRRLRTIHELSSMGSVAVRFTPEAETAAAVSGAASSGSLFVLFARLAGALKAVENGLDCDELTVGHVPAGEGRTELRPSVFLGPEEYDVVAALQQQGVSVMIQPLPTDSVVPIQPQAATIAPPPSAPAGTTSKTEKMRIVNARGLHLRAAHLLAQLCTESPDEVSISSGMSFVNAKSVLGLTTLGAAVGSFVTVKVEGASADVTMAQIRDLVGRGFDEDTDGLAGSNGDTA